jgi:hypothetical protein
MTDAVCLTVDVEDWYDGMAVLGEQIDRPADARSGLDGLAALLESSPGRSAVTLFVVGNYAPRVGPELTELVDAGHEVASHGADHGHLPEDPAALLDWLRRGRAVLEDLVQRPVSGFRSPRFDIPASMELARYRALLAEAGFTYVSDTNRLGTGSPVRELPVLSKFGIPVGGGSYQRLLPATAVTSAVTPSVPPAVLYYHSYDFGATLPGTGSIRSLAMAKQLIGRQRVARIFNQILSRYGSKACGDVER